jgi:hypothetical protein
VRRTSSIGAIWPRGLGQEISFTARARDVFTPTAGDSPVQLAEASLRIATSVRRDIISIEASRLNDQVQRLLGTSLAGPFRSALREIVPDEAAAASPLHLLLDDLVGASLVSTWAWQRIDPDWLETRRRMNVLQGLGRDGTVVDVCSGFRAGSSALLPDGMPTSTNQSSAPVPSLRHPDDAEGWHDLTEAAGVSYMRARRMDIVEDDVVAIDIGFQDSAVGPDSDQRYGVHEYSVRATASPDTLILLTLDVVGHLLPYPECSGALAAAERMIGRPLADFRRQVGKEIRGADGCTHLTDVLRSMADVPNLVQALRQASTD